MSVGMANFLAALAIALLKFAIERGAKPRELYDAETPDSVRRAWSEYLADRLRDRADRGTSK